MAKLHKQNEITCIFSSDIFVAVAIAQAPLKLFLRDCVMYMYV